MAARRREAVAVLRVERARRPAKPAGGPVDDEPGAERAPVGERRRRRSPSRRGRRPPPGVRTRHGRPRSTAPAVPAMRHDRTTLVPRVTRSVPVTASLAVQRRRTVSARPSPFGRDARSGAAATARVGGVASTLTLPGPRRDVAGRVEEAKGEHGIARRALASRIVAAVPPDPAPRDRCRRCAVPAPPLPVAGDRDELPADDVRRAEADDRRRRRSGRRRSARCARRDPRTDDARRTRSIVIASLDGWEPVTGEADGQV